MIEHSWKFAVPTMNRPDFLSSLLGFDKDRVNDEDVELLFPYLAAEDFTYEAAKKASGNVAGLCVWIKAMKTYTEIAKVVKPHPSPSPGPSPGPNPIPSVAVALALALALTLALARVISLPLPLPFPRWSSRRCR